MHHCTQGKKQQKINRTRKHIQQGSKNAANARGRKQKCHNHQQPNKTKGRNHTTKTPVHHPTTTPDPWTAQCNNNKSCTYCITTKRNTNNCYMPQQTSPTQHHLPIRGRGKSTTRAHKSCSKCTLQNSHPHDHPRVCIVPPWTTNIPSNQPNGRETRLWRSHNWRQHGSIVRIYATQQTLVIYAPMEKLLWQQIGRLAQGIPGWVHRTNTIFFVHKHDIWQTRKKISLIGELSVTTDLAKPNQTGCSYWLGGGDRINYPEDCGTPTADLLIVKLMLNSAISSENAKFLTMDITNFYLNTLLKWYEYLCLKLVDIPPDVAEQYALQESNRQQLGIWWDM